MKEKQEQPEQPEQPEKITLKIILKILKTEFFKSMSIILLNALIIVPIMVLIDYLAKTIGTGVYSLIIIFLMLPYVDQISEKIYLKLKPKNNKDNEFKEKQKDNDKDKNETKL